MTKYDEIYVPPDENQEPLGSDYALYSNDRDGDGDYLDDLIRITGPIICLTLEELREMWEKAENKAYLAGKDGGGLDTQNLHNYLTSKEINTIP